MIVEKKINFFYRKCILMMGLFATMPVVTINFGDRDISIFRVFYYLILLYLIGNRISHQKLALRSNIKKLYAWLMEATIAGLLGWVLLNAKASTFANAAISYVPKTIAFLLFALCWGGQDKRVLSDSNNCLVKGLMAGCFANVIWAMIDAAGYYIVGESINNIVFSGYIARHEIRYNSLSLIYGNTGLIRSGGFNYDPAQLGFMVPVIVVYAMYKRKYWIMLLAVGGILASASTTALVCSVLVIMINVNIKRSKAGKRFTKKTLAVCFVFIGIVGGLFLICGDQIIYLTTSAFTKMYDRVTTVYLDTGSSDIRWDYLRFVPFALFNLGIKGVFGLGFGTSSYGYATDNYILSVIGTEYNFAYDLENTYICYLLDTGIIGFILFLYYLIPMTKVYRIKCRQKNPNEIDIEIYSFILAMIFSMLFYHYILFAPMVLLTIAALSQMDVS